MTRSKVTLAILATLGVSAQAMDMKAYREMKVSSEQYVRAYVHGLGSGFFTANVALQAHSQPRLFCPPDNLPFTESTYFDILNAQIAVESDLLPTAKFDATPIEFTLLDGLKRVFPCGK